MPQHCFTPVSMTHRLGLGQGIPSRGQGNARQGFQGSLETHKVPVQTLRNCFSACCSLLFSLQQQWVVRRRLQQDELEKSAALHAVSLIVSFVPPPMCMFAGDNVS